MSQKIIAQFTVPAELGEVRLDQVLSELMPEHSRSRIQGWIKEGSVRVNGSSRKPKDKVMVGDAIEVSAEVVAQDRWEAQSITLDIVYEDDDIIVINKPAGLVVHPAAGHADGTLVNALLHHCPQVDLLPRAGVVHRLDKDTSGIMVVAKSLVAHTSLVEQLQERSMGREYEAVVFGVMTGGGKVDEPIGRHPGLRTKMAVHPGGKPAVTHYRVLQRFGAYTHIRLKLESGRTHQIRVHMAHIRYPLVGDPVYGGRFKQPAGMGAEARDVIKRFGRQALHAKKLTLWHPVNKQQMSWEIPLADDFAHLLGVLTADGAS